LDQLKVELNGLPGVLLVSSVRGDRPRLTRSSILLRSRQKGLIDKDDGLSRLSSLAKHGRYKSSILEDAKRRLEEQLWPRR